MQYSFMWLLRLNSKARGEHLTFSKSSHWCLSYLSGKWFKAFSISGNLFCFAFFWVAAGCFGWFLSVSDWLWIVVSILWVVLFGSGIFCWQCLAVELFWAVVGLCEILMGHNGW